MATKKRTNSKSPAKRVLKRGTTASVGRTAGQSPASSARSRDSSADLRTRLTAVEKAVNKLQRTTETTALTDNDPRSTFEIWKSMGFIGAVEGPADLSTNPKYMEGFGES